MDRPTAAQRQRAGLHQTSLENLAAERRRGKEIRVVTLTTDHRGDVRADREVHGPALRPRTGDIDARTLDNGPDDLALTA